MSTSCLGGRLESEETPVHALIREVEEETGLIVEENSIEEIGEIIEIRKDVFDDSKKYVCHNLYYKCDVKTEKGNLHRSQNEIEKGLKLEWVDANEMIASNIALELESSRERDTIFMEMIVHK